MPITKNYPDSRVRLAAELTRTIFLQAGSLDESIKAADAVLAQWVVLDPADDALPDRLTLALNDALRASPVALVWDHDQTLTFYGVIVRDTIRRALADQS